MKNKFFSKNKNSIFTEKTEKLAYLAGFIIGDGNLGQGYIIRAVEKNREFIESYTKIFDEVFSRKPKIYFDEFNNSFVAYLHSKEIWSFFIDYFEIPPGTKSQIVRIPQKILASDNAIKSALLSGLFDAEGSVIMMRDSHHKKGYPRIQFKVHNNNLAKDVHHLLKSLKINSKLYKYTDFSMIQINGKKQCTLFNSNIGFSHPLKDQKLRVFL